MTIHANSLANLGHNTRGRPKLRITAISNAKMMKALMDGLLTIPEIAEECGLHPSGVGKYCAALYREGVIRIHHWEEDIAGRRTLRVYAFRMNGEKDAKPPRATPSQRQAKHRAKLKMVRHQNIILGIAA